MGAGAGERAVGEMEPRREGSLRLEQASELVEVGQRSAVVASIEGDVGVRGELVEDGQHGRARAELLARHGPPNGNSVLSPSAANMHWAQWGIGPDVRLLGSLDPLEALVGLGGAALGVAQLLDT